MSSGVAVRLLLTSVCQPVLLCVQETLKSVIAQYNASQLLTMREVRLASCSMSTQCVQSFYAHMLHAASNVFPPTVCLEASSVAVQFSLKFSVLIWRSYSA